MSSFQTNHHNHNVALVHPKRLHERTSFGIAHYENRESVQNMRQIKASTFKLVYLSSVIDSCGLFRKQFIMNFN